MRDILKKIEKISEQLCIAPHAKIMVRPNGDVFPCSAWNHSVGNLFRKGYETDMGWLQKTAL
ncbi:MAG: SPASM domain-containing protein [Nitrososphaerales archaeon]